MTLYKTTIEWTEFTWKIITGCKHGCPYCYVRRWDKEMTPRYHEDRLYAPIKRKKPSRIFVANTGDMFGNWVPNEWIVNIMGIIHRCPQHIFQLLTKNPRRMAEWSWPQNVWAGTTIATQVEIERIEIIKQVHAKIRFVCFEPILGAIDYPSFKGIDWIIIGAESVGKSYIPRDAAAAQRWATPLIAQIKKEGIPLFLKPNLQWPEQIKELPLGTVGVEI